MSKETMEFQRILALKGPNVWSRRTCLEAWVDIGPLQDSPSNLLPGLYERLAAWLPGLIEHRCGVGERGGFLMRLRDGTYAAHMLEHVAIELQNLAGTPVGFGKARETSRPGLYKVAIRYRNETVARACLEAGRDLLLAAIHDHPYDVADTVARLRDVADSACLGPSTAAIVDAAEARGIPTHRLTDASLVQLGQGVRQHRIWTAETDRTGAIGEWIASDKDMTKRLLHACGVPIPEGRLVDGAEDAWAAAQSVGLPVVVKPRDANHGRGVFTDLSSREEINNAYGVAVNEGSGVIVERFVRGNEHRLLVVGHSMVAAARGETAWVVGDGCSTVRDLVTSQIDSDPRRGLGEDFPLNFIELDDPVVLLDLRRQGYSADSVPADGARVMVQRNGNVAFDVTDIVHPRVAASVVLAARVVGLDVAGIDIVAEDITRPLEEQGGAVVEVNAGPGLSMHLKPAAGTPRPVGEAIVDSLFAPGESGRIPLVCVTGTSGKTVVTRLIAHLLRTDGRHVGLACSDGLYLGSRVIDTCDRADALGARKALMNPSVEAAVLEAGGPSILREGLGFDRCDVAVVTNIGQGDHLGLHYIESPDALYSVKRCAVDVVLPTGTAVLNAADPLVAEMSSLSAGTVIFFALDAGHPILGAHRAAGGRVVTVRDGRVVLAEGDVETPVADVSALPVTHGGRVPFQVENVLAAVAAGWALGLSFGTLGAGVLSFDRDGHELPGRFTCMERDGATVVIDAVRNPLSGGALAAALDHFPARRRTFVGVPGVLRRDADLEDLGRILGATFDRIVLCGSEPATQEADAVAATRIVDALQPSAGSLRTPLRRGASSGGRVVEIVVVPGQREAVEAALDALEVGDLLVLQADEFHPGSTVDQVREWMVRHA